MYLLSLDCWYLTQVPFGSTVLVLVGQAMPSPGPCPFSLGWGSHRGPSDSDNVVGMAWHQALQSQNTVDVSEQHMREATPVLLKLLLPYSEHHGPQQDDGPVRHLSHGCPLTIIQSHHGSHEGSLWRVVGRGL